MLTLNDIDCRNKRVLLRVDFNVPLKEGVVQNDARLKAVVPTIQRLLKLNTAIILVSHCGRPKTKADQQALSLTPVADKLAGILAHPVRFETHWQQGLSLNPGEIVLLENVRFLAGEMENDTALARELAKLADIVVFDAFGVAHRKQASSEALIRQAKVAVAGPLMVKEFQAIECLLKDPKRPLLAIVGGAKVSGKLQLLQSLSTQVDHLIVGGGILNTFIAAQGYAIGQSLYEPDLVSVAKALMQEVDIAMPIDVIVADKMSADATTRCVNVNDVKENDAIFDIGPQTAASWSELITNAGTILWNGPVGVFELAPFAAGTQALAQSIANSAAYTVAGGGDTVAAIDAFDVRAKVNMISTGGGAFLEALIKELPTVAALRARALD